MVKGIRNCWRSDSLLAQIQSSVLLEITKQHAWWLVYLSGREEELKQYDSPALPRGLWATHLRLILSELYSARSVNLAKNLIVYLENDCDCMKGDLYLGVEDFHVVWEHMLRQVLVGVEHGWNSRLPRLAYQKSLGGFDVQDRGLRLDIVLRDGMVNFSLSMPSIAMRPLSQISQEYKTL